MSQEDSITFERVTIVGPGLLGASIAMGLKDHNIANEVWVWTRNENKIDICMEKNWCDYATNDLKEAVEGSDLIILCTPINTILKQLTLLCDWVKPNSIVTDVGSLKKEICQLAEKRFNEKKSFFIGSHPMAGSEKSGMEFSNCKILLSKSCIITPTKNTDSFLIRKINIFWKKLGMVVSQMDPEKHDEVVGTISHLPHLIATALINTAFKDSKNELYLSGDGLRDTTRIAAGNPDMWEQIIFGNRDNLLVNIASIIEELNKFKRVLTKKDKIELGQILREGKLAREVLNDQR